MNNIKPCKHEKLEYFGIQPTLNKNEPLFLFNCKNCNTTLSFSKKDMFLMLHNTFKKPSI